MQSPAKCYPNAFNLNKTKANAITLNQMIPFILIENKHSFTKNFQLFSSQEFKTLKTSR